MNLFLRMFAVSLLAVPLSADVILTMKSGERYELPQAPKHRNGMVSFTTKDHRFLTVKQSEVASEQKVVPVVPEKKADRTDTRQLGAIAREQRAERGIDADVAGKTQADKPTKTEKPAPRPKKPARRTKKQAAPPPSDAPPPASSEPR